MEECYFGGVRKGKRDRGAAGKVPVFGLLKRGGRVYAKVIPYTKSHTLKSIIEQRVVRDSIVYTITDRITSWTYQALNISGLIMPNGLQTNRTIFMALKTFGIRPSGTCGDVMRFPKCISPCF